MRLPKSGARKFCKPTDSWDLFSYGMWVGTEWYEEGPRKSICVGDNGGQKILERMESYGYYIIWKSLDSI